MIACYKEVYPIAGSLSTGRFLTVFRVHGQAVEHEPTGHFQFLPLVLLGLMNGLEEAQFLLADRRRERRAEQTSALVGEIQ